MRSRVDLYSIRVEGVRSLPGLASVGGYQSFATTWLPHAAAVLSRWSWASYSSALALNEGLACRGQRAALTAMANRCRW